MPGFEPGSFASFMRGAVVLTCNTRSDVLLSINGDNISFDFVSYVAVSVDLSSLLTEAGRLEFSGASITDVVGGLVDIDVMDAKICARTGQPIVRISTTARSPHKASPLRTCPLLQWRILLLSRRSRKLIASALH